MYVYIRIYFYTYICKSHLRLALQLELEAFPGRLQYLSDPKKKPRWICAKERAQEINVLVSTGVLKVMPLLPTTIITIIILYL